MIKIPVLWFLFHLLLLYQFFQCNSGDLKVIKIFIKRICIYMKNGERFILVRYFNVVHFLNVIIFEWTNFFWVFTIFRVSIVKLDNTKSSRFEEDFNDNGLLWSFSRSIQWVLLLSVFVQQKKKFLLLHKEELCCNILCNSRIDCCFEDTAV